MHAQKRLFLIINILGGIAVLGSYILGFIASSEAGTILWGGVPQGLRPIYTFNMFLAAAGYLLFSIFILSLDPDKTRIKDRFSFRVFNIIFAVILFFSALWMPLTLVAIEKSSLASTWLVRIDLAAVALGSLGLFAALLTVQPRRPSWLHRMAVIGCIFFCLQTVVLDAIVWVFYFHP